VFLTLLRSVLRLVFRIRICGNSEPLSRGGVLVVANQDSLLDAVLLGLFLPGRPLVVATREAVNHPLTRLLLRAVPYVALDPGRPLGVKRLIQQVRSGRTVVLFPQGRTTTTGGLMKVYDAAGVIAWRCDTTIVPVRIEGTLYSRLSLVAAAHRRRLFPRVTLHIHASCKLAPLPVLPARERRRRLADAVLRLMQDMLATPVKRTTLFGALLDAMALHGRTTRIVEDVRGLPESYGALVKSALALGRVTSRITAPGEIVGVMMPNVSVSLALVLGLSAMRRIPGMLNYTSSAESLLAACTAAGIRNIITSRRFVEMARIEPSIRALERFTVHYVEDMRRQLTLLDKLWLVLCALPRPRAVQQPADWNDTAIVLFTSGSESRPKGVALSHRGILANVDQMRATIDFGPGDKYLNALPLYHTFGLIACSLLPLYSGTRLLLYTNPLHYRVIPELVYTRDCTYIFGTSTFLGHYGRHAHPYDFYRVRVVVCGGEKLNEAVAELWLRQFGIRIMEGYGATECGPAMALNTPLCYRPGTVGRFMPGVEHRLVPVTGIERGGALHVRSPNLMKGYYFFEQPGRLQPARSEVGAGWYSTGDVVDVDDEGYVSILGRVKRFAKIAGEMVSLELVERIAYDASPGCKHAATVEELSGTGESTVLFTTDPLLDRISLHQAARRLGARDLAVARRIIKVPALPLLGSGKTDYVTLKEHIVRRA
jgi:acyl-[acyl-carrier-protein]-phospholipid O-acyltransferase/long-chain-fatty-acid--[acyl-carrier-protein] ligase